MLRATVPLLASSLFPYGHIPTLVGKWAICGQILVSVGRVPQTLRLIISPGEVVNKKDSTVYTPSFPLSQ